MTVLSDSTLQSLSNLIKNGSKDNARHCAYEFKPERVVYGGKPDDGKPKVVDFSKGDTTAAIPPAGVVWVRTREQVEMPANLVGLWVQTNSLSREGLLLLNSTLVEPGYKGYLSAHLVNLSTNVLAIGPSDTIAKLVFFRLDKDAVDLIDASRFSGYDAMLDKLALKSKASFMRVADFVPDLKQEAGQVVKDTIEATRQEMSRIEAKTFWRLGGGFVMGLALALTFAVSVFPKIREVDIESTARMTEIVKAQNAELQKKIENIEKLLQKQNQTSSQPANPP